MRKNAYNVRTYPPTEKKPRWRVCWYENKKRIERAFTHERDAREFAQVVIVRLHAGQSVKTATRTRRTVGDEWDAYVAYKTPGIGQGYIDQLHRFRRSELKPYERLPLSEFDQSTIQKIIDTKTTHNARSRIVEKIRPFLKWAYQENKLSTPPATILQGLRINQGAAYTPRRGSAQTVRSFSMNEVYSIARATETLHTHEKYGAAHPAKNRMPAFCTATAVMILLQASTGLRIGELKGLRIGDIVTYAGELFPSEIHITKQFKEMPGGAREITPPKNGVSRVVTIPTWTAPTQISHTGTYRTASQILAEFGADHTATTWAQLTKARCEWLTKQLRPTYPTIYIDWGDAAYLMECTTIRTLKNVTVTTNEEDTVSLQAFADADRFSHPHHSRLWEKFYDTGGILPLREMLAAYIEKLQSQFSTRTLPDPWRETNATFTSGLLWPALRPPRTNTRIPTGAEKPLPWNGNWVPQQLTRDFLRTALETAGIHDTVQPGRTRRTMRELRHTFAITALRMGVPVPVVSQQLGHSDPSVTLSRYAKHIAWGTAPNFTL